MKTTLVLCCFAILAGCGGGQKPAKGPGKDAMDSPIIISDGSTHLRHKAASGNKNGDFQIISKSGNQTTVAAVASASTSVSRIEFYGGGWNGNPRDIPASPGWALNVYSDNGVTLTLALSSSKPATTTILTAVFYNPVQLSCDGSDTGGGTSIDDTSSNIAQINYAPAGGSLASYATCATPGKCKIKFHYDGN